MSPNKLPLISVCVCSYKRPELLHELLNSLAEQQVNGFTFEVIVVDNDIQATAKPVIDSIIQRPLVYSIHYEVEPKQGISFARNRTIQVAQGEYIAFIDDDERASPTWLTNLFDTLNEKNADAAFGPVLPVYPENSNQWVVSGRFFERPRFPNGSLVGSGDSRTSNALVKASWCRDRLPTCFDERLAHSGGEDHDFFKWVEAEGGKFVWSDTAIVSEFVPFDRQTAYFILERNLRSSITYWRRENTGNSKLAAWVRAIYGVMGGVALLAVGSFLLPVRKDKAIQLCVKAMKGFGRMGAISHIQLVGYGPN